MEWFFQPESFLPKMNYESFFHLKKLKWNNDFFSMFGETVFNAKIE